MSSQNDDTDTQDPIQEVVIVFRLHASTYQQASLVMAAWLRELLNSEDNFPTGFQGLYEKKEVM
jgi:hypothetical protein